VQSSLAKLKKLDLVEQDEAGWLVTDPIFCKWLAQYAGRKVSDEVKACLTPIEK